MICASVKRLFLMRLLLPRRQTLHQNEEPFGGQVSHRDDVGGSGVFFEVEWQQIVDIGVERSLGQFSENMA